MSRAIQPQQVLAPERTEFGIEKADVLASQVAEIEALRFAWERLPSQTPLQSFIWARSCAAAFPADGLQVFAPGRPNARAIAIFVENQGSGALLPLGHETAEPAEFVYADDAAAEELSESIAHSGKAVRIHDIYAASPVLRGLRRAAGRRLVTHPAGGHPWLELDDTWLEPESHLNPGRRSDLRRALRNAQKIGPVSCEIKCPAPGELAQLLQDAFRVEAAGWKGILGSALAVDPKVGAFYKQFTQEACRLGTLRMGILRIGERAAAMQLGVEQNGCFWLFKMGFDESFARCSPGMLLFVESLRRARENGCYRYETMGRSEPWNQMWSPRLHEAVAVSLCEASARGWIGTAAERTTGAVSAALLNRMKERSIGRRIRHVVLPLVQFAARSYIAGPELKDALQMARKMASHGRGSTIGFWDTVGDVPDEVFATYLELARALQTESIDPYVSVKAPSLEYSHDRCMQLVRICEARGTRIHFDSLWPDSVEPTWKLIDQLLPVYPNLSCTLPGRWKRSLEDAEWVIERGIGVRVVKGQWSDATTPPIDDDEGFLAVIKRLAGRARWVAVATHRPEVAQASFEVLRNAGTPCELELLFGLPSSAVLGVAKRMNVPTRLYIPYGSGWLPYSLHQLHRNPRILWWILKDTLRSKSRERL